MAYLMLRGAMPQLARRFYATASSSVAHGHSGRGGEIAEVHPLFNPHPKAPVATYDDWPVPVLSYKEGYEKPQAAFNMLLAASVAAFTAVSAYVWKYDILGTKQAGAPSWYTKRQIGKGLGEI